MRDDWVGTGPSNTEREVTFVVLNIDTVRLQLCRPRSTTLVGAWSEQMSMLFIVSRDTKCNKVSNAMRVDSNDNSTVLEE